MARSAGYQLPLASRSPPCLSPPPFSSVPLWTSLGLTFLAVITPPALHPSLCPSRCPSQEGASCPLLPCQSAWVGCGPAPCEARPKPQAGRGQRSSSEAGPLRLFPFAPSARPRGQRRFSKIHGLGPEAPGSATQGWGEGVAVCMHVWGTGKGSCSRDRPHQQVFSVSARQGWGDDVGRPCPCESGLSELCLRSSAGWVRELLSEPLSSSLN